MCYFRFGDALLPIAMESPRLHAVEAEEVRFGKERTLLRGKVAVVAPLNRLGGAEEKQEGYLHKTDEQTSAHRGMPSMLKV